MANAKKTLTAANSSIVMNSLTGDIQFSGFTLDNNFTTDSVKHTETRIGVDGVLSAGYVPTIKHVDITLEATSETIDKLFELRAIGESSKTPIPVVMTIMHPALNQKFICTGYFTDAPGMPSFSNTQQPVTFGFDFGDVLPMPL